MISVIHQSGTSFKGLAAYLLHDVGADTSDRVAWTHTHNLATDDPELAWRIQASTAMNQSELKAQAGIANTGRRSNAHVMHYTLSWHPEEYGELTRAEMLAAALGSMSYIGTTEGEKIGKNSVAKRTQFADEHQALIVCHDEGADKPLHVHVMLNRVHPGHGVMLPDSKDYEKLSRWATDYRRAQGKEDYCPQRQQNAAKRAQGYMTSHPRKPRNVYLHERALEQAEPGSRGKTLLEHQRRQAAKLARKEKVFERQAATDIRQMEEHHLIHEKLERARAADEIRRKKASIKSAYSPEIDALGDRQGCERRAFEEAQNTLRGRVRNSWAALKTKEWMAEIRRQKMHVIADAFKLAFSSGMQRQALDAFHARERQQLDIQRRRAEQQAACEIRAQERERLEVRQRLFVQQRNDLILKQSLQRAKLKTEWRQLEKDRRAAAREDERPRQKDLAGEQVRRQEKEPTPSETELKPTFDLAAAPLRPTDRPPDESDRARELREFSERMNRARRVENEHGRESGR